MDRDDLERMYLMIQELKTRKEGRVIDFLFPDTDLTIKAGEFPYGHKLFESPDGDAGDTIKLHARSKYKKHLEFFEAGNKYIIRLFQSGNRVGKTTAAACELVYHLTGDYPRWWKGKVFTTCRDWWVCGKTSETVKQILQPLLLGSVGNFGSGLVPRDRLDLETLTDAKKTSTGISSFRVRHKNGTYSTVEFKSFDQGRQAFEGTARSVWIDEEPPAPVFTECLLRTLTGGNITMMTFTPLKGASEVVMGFYPQGDVTAEGDVGDGRFITRVSMDEVPHLPKDKIELILSRFLPHERKARRFGIPFLGSGAIYPVDEESFIIEPFEIPKHWQKGYGLDVGRNTGATWITRDPDSGNVYTYSDFLMVEGTPSNHVDAIQARGKWLKGAIDTSARGRSQTDGENLFDIYKEKGLHLVNADKAVSAGIYEVLEMLISGRLKVFSTCTALIKEIRSYQRDEKGQIIKKNDHCADSWRYAVFNRDKILRTEAEFKAYNEPVMIPYEEAPYSEDGWAV